MSINTQLVGVLSDGTSVQLDNDRVSYHTTGNAITEKEGVLSAKSSGVSDVTASYTYEGKVWNSQVATLAVSSAEVDTITISTGDVALITDMSQELQAQATLTDGTKLDVSLNASWDVSDNAVATIT